MERVKSAVLTVLVTSSLILTWRLWVAQPPFEAAESSYTSLVPLGEEMDLRQLIVPQEMIFHDGAGTHRLAPAASSAQARMLKQLAGWELVAPVRIAYHQVPWQEMRQDEEGVEMRFFYSLSWEELGLLMGVPVERFEDTQRFNRLWLVLRRSEEAHSASPVLYLISDSPQFVYRAEVLTAGETNPSAVNKALPPLGSLPQVDFYSFKTGDHPGYYRNMGLPEADGFYLPRQAPQLEAFEFSYEKIPTERMLQYLFIDPALAREIVERDGTFLYTDGSRSVQVDPTGMRMSYDAPASGVTPANRELPGNDLRAAVQFINSHGGWPGTFLLEARASQGENSHFRFRWTVNSLPVVGEPENSENAAGTVLRQAAWDEGALDVTVRKREVLAMTERLFLIEHPPETETEETLLSGEEVYQYIRGETWEGRQIRRIYPAYRVGFGGEKLRLEPVWVVEDGFGRREFLPGREAAENPQP